MRWSSFSLRALAADADCRRLAVGAGPNFDGIDYWHRTVLPTVTRETRHAGTAAYGRQCMNVYELIDGCKSRAERQPGVTRAVGGVWLLDQTHQRFFLFY